MAMMSSLRFIPKNSIGDRLHALINFARSHHRLPTQKLLFNDYLYRMKTSSELCRPEREFVTDKEFVKLFVTGTVGSCHAIPTLAVLRTDEEIDAYGFPDQCCVKPTHASGLIFFRTAGEPLDRDEIKRWLRVNYYETDREANYRKLKPKIIVEPLVWGVPDPIDFKVYCYQGSARLVQVHLNRFTEHTQCFYDRDWTLQDYSLIYPRNPVGIARPENLDQMIAVAEAIAAHFTFIRVDLYSDGAHVLVGELTNCCASANGCFRPVTGEFTASKTLFGPLATVRATTAETAEPRLSPAG